MLKIVCARIAEAMEEKEAEEKFPMLSYIFHMKKMASHDKQQ